MRHLLILACLLFGTGATADEADFDFKSLGAKKALRDYKKAVAKDEEEAANLAKKTRDAFVESLKGALKQSMQAGNLDEANKISDAIKALKKGVSPPDATASLENLIGTWKWGDSDSKSKITFHKNGSVTSSWGVNGRWERRDRRVVIIWAVETKHGLPEWHSFDFPIDAGGVTGDGWGGPGKGGSPGKLK